MDWAELVTLDLSLFSTPGGKEKLAEQLEYAAQHVGFFYVKNFGITQEEVMKQFALGREFYDLPLEEKLKYHNLEDLRRGEYNGYRPAGLRQCVQLLMITSRLLTLSQAHRQHPRQRTGLQPAEVRRLSRATAAAYTARPHP